MFVYGKQENMGRKQQANFDPLKHIWIFQRF
jgi:hypothetical protein